MKKLSVRSCVLYGLAVAVWMSQAACNNVDCALTQGSGIFRMDALQRSTQKRSNVSKTRFMVKMRPAKAGAVHAEAVLTSALPKNSQSKKLKENLFDVQFADSSDASRSIEQLRIHPAVERVEADTRVHAYAEPNDPMLFRQWFHRTIQSSAAWDMSTGGETLVAVLDTGVNYDHPDLAANMYKNPGEIEGNKIDDDGDGFVDNVYGWNFIDNSNRIRSDDDHTHGTHVAGIIGAVADDKIGGAGVAPKVRIMALKFLSADGSGSTDDAVTGIYYAIRRGVRIINASWGGGDSSETLKEAIADAGKAGVLFVAAAGNGGDDGRGDNNDTTPEFPSTYDLTNIISVAATDCSDSLTSFSNFGKRTVDVAAPGADILSTYKQNEYAYLSGTSMATPVVSGIAAMMMSLKPELTSEEIRNRLFASVDPIPQLEGKVATGGRVNLLKALRSVAPTLARVPAAQPETTPSFLSALFKKMGQLFSENQSKVCTLAQAK